MTTCPHCGGPALKEEVTETLPTGEHVTRLAWTYEPVVPCDEAAVERAAKALRGEERSHATALLVGWDDMPEFHREPYRIKARTVIAALRAAGEEEKP